MIPKKGSLYNNVVAYLNVVSFYHSVVYYHRKKYIYDLHRSTVVTLWKCQTAEKWNINVTLQYIVYI